MKLIKFINKTIEPDEVLIKIFWILKHKYIYFEITENYETLDLIKSIFIERYRNKASPYWTKEFDDKIFSEYFDYEIIENDFFQIENDAIIVSKYQILFDKLWYIDFEEKIN